MSLDEKRMAGRLVGIARTIVQYAIQNLPFLIFDPDTEKARPEMDNAFKYLCEHVADPAEPTLNEIAAALEATADAYSIQMLDEMLSHLDIKMKLVIASGEALAKVALKWKKSFARQLRDERDRFVLKLMRHPSTMEAYDILQDKPKILRFITTYLFIRLGIPGPQPKETVKQQEAPQVQK